jgi:hypothetical protein
MKLPGSPSSLYERILGLAIVPAKADTGCCGCDHMPKCLSDLQLKLFIVFYLVLVKKIVLFTAFFFQNLFRCVYCTLGSISCQQLFELCYPIHKNSF